MTRYHSLSEAFSAIWDAYLYLWEICWPITAMVHLYILIQLTWVHFLAVMNLSRNRNKLTKFAKFWAYSILAVGYPLDILFNLVFGTIFLLELPKELLFTARCNRLIEEDTWRGNMARWFCRNMLDPFDPNGTHCDHGSAG